MSDRLYRSRHDRMLAGVAGGLAELWDADPSLVRIVWAMLVVLTGGIALVVYIVMALVVPEEDDFVASQPMPGYPTTYPAPPSPAESPRSPGTPGTTPEPMTAGPDAAAFAAGQAGTAWTEPLDPREARRQAREARRAARRERRGAGAGSGPLLIGAVLILLGVYFLVRQYIPALDWNWFWPLVLIALGVVVLGMAVGRGPHDDSPGSGGRR